MDISIVVPAMTGIAGVVTTGLVLLKYRTPKPSPRQSLNPLLERLQSLEEKLDMILTEEPEVRQPEPPKPVTAKPRMEIVSVLKVGESYTELKPLVSLASKSQLTESPELTQPEYISKLFDLLMMPQKPQKQAEFGGSLLEGNPLE